MWFQVFETQKLKFSTPKPTQAMALYYALSPLLPPMARQGEVALATLPADPSFRGSQMARVCITISRREKNLLDI